MSSKIITSGMCDDDAWDDTELIRAYDKAVKQWKKNKQPEAETVTPGPGPWVTVKESDNYTPMDTFKEPFRQDPVNDCYSSSADAIYTGSGTSLPVYDATSEKACADVKSFMPHFPVPPLPASLACPDGTFNYDKGELPALLMSWYMSGYQAGYFDAKRNIGTQNLPK